MPIYEYRCEDCGTITEALRQMAAADDPMRCEKCDSERMVRMHSVVAATTGGREATLPMAGGCCPCGDPAGPCNLRP